MLRLVCVTLRLQILFLVDRLLQVALQLRRLVAETETMYTVIHTTREVFGVQVGALVRELLPAAAQVSAGHARQSVDC